MLHAWDPPYQHAVLTTYENIFNKTIVFLSFLSLARDFSLSSRRGYRCDHSPDPGATNQPAGCGVAKSSGFRSRCCTTFAVGPIRSWPKPAENGHALLARDLRFVCSRAAGRLSTATSTRARCVGAADGGIYFVQSTLFYLLTYCHVTLTPYVLYDKWSVMSGGKFKVVLGRRNTRKSGH